MSAEDDTYSTIFTTLKHPIRRRILRILDQNPTTYTDIQRQLQIDNGLLNYHLENMKELITKGEDGRYVLSEFGRAALGVARKVEEPVETKRTSVSTKTLLGIVIILVIATTTLSGFNVILFNNYQTQSAALAETRTVLDSANIRLNRIAPLGDLMNISQPATWTTFGVQIVKGFPMSYRYQNLSASTDLNDDSKSVITFYVPEDGAAIRFELLAVNPVNVYDLHPTLQVGNAWRNDTRIDAGTVGKYFNLTDPNNPNLSLTVWQSPIVWSFKTSGVGVYESPKLSRGWYTFSMFGPVIAYSSPHITGTTQVRTLYAFYPSVPGWQGYGLMSYEADASFSIMHNGEPTFFAFTTDH